MSASVKFYNTHSIFVKTGLATEEQLNQSVAALKSIVIKNFPEYKDNLGILVNYVLAKGVSVGYSYLWIDSTEIFYMLTGFNPDGTDRFEEEKPSEDIEELSNFENLSFEKIIEIYNSKPRLMRALPPLLSIPAYIYTEEQKSKVIEQLIEAKRTETGLEDPDISDENTDYGFFVCVRSSITNDRIKPGSDRCKLYGEVKEWVTEKMLMNNFGRFNTSEFKDATGKPKYPQITIMDHTNPERKRLGLKKVFIQFFNTGSSSYDATFALQMNRKCKFTKIEKVGGKDTVVETVEHVFDYFRSAAAGNTSPTGSPPKIQRSNEFLTRNSDTGFATRAAGSSDDKFTTVRRR